MAIIKKNKKALLISPLEFRHFVLDIPKINEKYQKQAVQFALKSYYPGTDENTSIDYAYYNSKVIGIAVNTNKLNSIKNKNTDIISPSLVIMNSFKEGIFICCSKEWVELQVINEGQILSIHTFSITSIKTAFRKLKEFKNNNNFKNNEITLINNDGDISIFENLLQSEKYEYTVCAFDQLLNNAYALDIYIFNKNDTTSKNFIYYLFVIILTTILIITLLYTQTKKQKLESQLNNLKLEYSELKSEMNDKESLIIQNNKPEINQVHPLYEIFSEICNTSDSIIINSFECLNNTIRFEAENANAIEVLDNLKKSDFIYDITLIQSIPKDDGKEKFIITGKIK